MSRQGGEGGDGGKRSPWGAPKRGPGARAPGGADRGARQPGTRPDASEPKTGTASSAARDKPRERAWPDAPKVEGRQGWQPREGGSGDSRSGTRGPWQGGGAARAGETKPGGGRDRANSGRPPRAEHGAKAQGPARAPAVGGSQRRPDRDAGTGAEPGPAGFAPRGPEQKICGLNAARAAFAARPEALRKVYLSESRIGVLRELLAFCVAERLGYRVVEDEELERISGSSHHEGVCLLMQPQPELDLDGLLAALPRTGPVRLLWLDGVGNPHNLGAVLRSAAHFGAQAVLLPPQSTLTLSAAAARVAEGGAEHVPLVRLPGQGASSEIDALERFAEAGFVSVATLPAGAPDLYAQPLPQRAVIVLGAEGEGMQKRLVEHCERAVSIPGSGRVESLNIANAVAVLLAEHWRQHPSRGERA